MSKLANKPNNYIKIMLNILSHEGMQIKTTHSFSPSSDGYHEESRSQQQTKTSAGLGCGGRGTLTYCYWECKLAQSLCKWVLIFLQRLEIELPYDLAIAPPGRNPSQQTAKLLGICACSSPIGNSQGMGSVPVHRAGRGNGRVSPEQ